MYVCVCMYSITIEPYSLGDKIYFPLVPAQDLLFFPTGISETAHIKVLIFVLYLNNNKMK